MLLGLCYLTLLGDNPATELSLWAGGSVRRADRKRQQHVVGRAVPRQSSISLFDPGSQCDAKRADHQVWARSRAGAGARAVVRIPFSPLSSWTGRWCCTTDYRHGRDGVDRWLLDPAVRGPRGARDRGPARERPPREGRARTQERHPRRCRTGRRERLWTLGYYLRRDGPIYRSTTSLCGVDALLFGHRL